MTMNALQQLLRATRIRWAGSIAPHLVPRLARVIGSDDPAPHRAIAGPTPCVRQLESEVLRLRDESASRTRLFAAAMHDLRQPLQALLLHSEALSHGAPSAEQGLHAARLRRSVASLDRLCAGLLDLTLIDSTHQARAVGPFALAPLFDDLRHTFEGLARTQGLRLVVRATALGAHGHPLMLTRMLNNLVCNALSHTSSGGVLVGARRSGGGVRIDVCDTGVGVPHEHQARVFQAIHEAHAPDAPGLGLGLATVRHLAQLQGARLGLRSEPGRGTTVSIHLRAAAPAGVLGRAGHAPPGLPASSRRTWPPSS